jgi:dTDP-4-amino-4,6-dideoxygalactose transaminase
VTVVERELPVPLTRMDHDDPALLEELLAVVRSVAETGAFTLGEHVEAFERDFAAYLDAGDAIGVSSGTAALELSLRALGIGPGDEVIVPANSFIATAEAVSAVGATPRFVDVDPDTQLVTAEIVAAAMGPAVRCVIPVHLYGSVVELDPLLALARDAGVAVVEDACQAHGAFYRGRRVGTLGDAGCFSFYPAKSLGGWGDGGAVATGDPKLADRVRLLRSHGERPRHRHRLIGATARLDALQAAILQVKLRGLDAANDERRELAGRLDALLVAAGVDRPRLASTDADHVHHRFVIRSEARDELRAHLAEHGIDSGVHYPVALHRTEAYAGLGLGPGSLPVCERLADRVCSLPLFPGMTEREADRVVRAVTAFRAVEAGPGAPR